MHATGPFHAKYDAVVVGARAAGASTAMLLARAGLRVLAVDRGREGTDTLSTHALMRAGVIQLRRWGLLERVIAAGTPPVRSATFHYGADATTYDVKPRDGVDALYAPRRTVLDPLLVAAAREAGARVEHRITAHALLQDDAGRVRGVVLTGEAGPPVDVEAGIVIGADGLHSRVAAHARAAVEHVARSATTSVYGHWSGLPANGYQWHFGDGVSAGAIPTNDGQTCVFVSMPRERYLAGFTAGLERLYREVLAEAAPQLAAALARARPHGKLHPFPGTPGYVRRSWGPGWALVGDAGCFKDPLTANGISDALRDAELLARAVVTGGDAALARYQLERDEIVRPLLEVTERIASLAWDLDEVRGLHHTLAKVLAAQAERVIRLDAPRVDRGELGDRAA